MTDDIDETSSSNLRYHLERGEYAEAREVIVNLTGDWRDLMMFAIDGLERQRAATQKAVDGCRTMLSRPVGAISPGGMHVALTSILWTLEYRDFSGPVT